MLVNWQFIKDNLKNGKWTWNGYIKQKKPDVKFGHNTFDYVCQIPVVGLVFMLMLEVFVYLICYPIGWCVRTVKTLARFYKGKRYVIS